jgi:uncharacterized membrane protein
VLNRTYYKGFSLNFKKVTEKRLNIILSLIQLNNIYNHKLLISLLLPKTAYVNKLNQISLIKQELNNLNMIYFRLNNKIVCFITYNAVK